MNATIVKQFRFEAAHQLPNHDGKCARPHGHSYKVEIAIHGRVKLLDGSSDEGMVLDFHEVGRVFKERVDARCDHQDLNVVLADEVPLTTAEHLAAWILEEMSAGLAPFADDCEVAWVRVWETATCYAEAAAS